MYVSRFSVGVMRTKTPPIAPGGALASSCKKCRMLIRRTVVCWNKDSAAHTDRCSTPPTCRLCFRTVNTDTAVYFNALQQIIFPVFLS